MSQAVRSSIVRKTPFGGILFAVVALGFRLLVIGHFYSWHAVSYQLSTKLGTTVWMFVGGLILGTVSLFLFFRHRLITPLLVTGGLFLVGAIHMWRGYTSLNGAVPNPVFTLLGTYLFFWFVPLVIAGIVGGIEYFIRKRFGGSSAPTFAEH